MVFKLKKLKGLIFLAALLPVAVNAELEEMGEKTLGDIRASQFPVSDIADQEVERELAAEKNTVNVRKNDNKTDKSDELCSDKGSINCRRIKSSENRVD